MSYSEILNPEIMAYVVFAMCCYAIVPVFIIGVGLFSGFMEHPIVALLCGLGVFIAVMMDSHR